MIRKRFENSSLASNKISKKGFQLYITEPAQAVLAVAGSYDKIQINQKIQQLSGMPRPQDAGMRIGSTDVYRVAVGHYRIDYGVFSGEVTIESLTMDSAYIDSSKKEKPGLYTVKRVPGDTWSTPARTQKVKTNYAAVNGMLNDLFKAANLMPSHVTSAFGNHVNEFTFYHNPTEGFLGDLWESSKDKFGCTTDLAKELGMILSDIQQDDIKVAWVVHSQGGAIFSEAVNYHNQTVGTSLNNNSVKFHSGANNSWYTQKILSKAGIEKIGKDNNHPYDIVPNIIGLNTANPVKWVGSVITAPALSDTSVLKYLKSPHTMPNTRTTWKFWKWNQ